MIKYIRLLVIFFITFFSFSMSALAYEIRGGNVGWVYDDRSAAGVSFELEEGWHIFWAHPGAVGISTKVVISQGSKTQELTNLWPAPKNFMVGPLEGWGYEGDVMIPVIFPNWVDPQKSYDLDITGQACKLVCVPFTIKDTILPTASQSLKNIEILKNVISSLPEPASLDVSAQAIFEPSKDNDDLANLHIEVVNPQGFVKPKIFEKAQQNLGYITKKIQVSKDQKTAIFYLEVSGLKFDPDALLDKNLELTIVDGKAAYYLSAPVKKDIVKSLKRKSISWILMLQALLVGLIFNIMPCVLPVLSIKLASVIGLSGAQKSEVRLRFVFTAIGILLAFALLAVVFAGLKLLGVYVGWGVHFQQPLFITFMMIVTSLFAASLFGFWSLRQPSITSKSLKTSILGEIGSGILATILATPCSVPFMAPVAVFAFAGSALDLLSIFLLIGLGMSLPWLIVALFPRLVLMLPKPGQWMIYVRYILGLMLAGTQIWLSWILFHQIDARTSLLISLLGFVAIGVLALRKTNLKWGISIFFYIAMLGLAWGAKQWEAEKIPASSVIQKGQLQGEIFTKKALSEAFEKEQNILVIGTADWCITCKVNEKRVLDRPHIIATLNQNNVKVLIADMTKENEEAQAWMQELERYGLPLTVYYRRLDDYDILPTLLSEKDILQLF